MVCSPRTKRILEVARNDDGGIDKTKMPRPGFEPPMSYMWVPRLDNCAISAYEPKSSERDSRFSLEDDDDDEKTENVSQRESRTSFVHPKTWLALLDDDTNL